MATALRTSSKGVINYSDMKSGIDIDLNTFGLSGMSAKVIASSFDDCVTSSEMSARQSISVGDGNDTMYANGYMNTYDGGLGDDTVSYAKTTNGIYADLATGMSDNGDQFIGVENLTGGLGFNTLLGNAGANRLIGNALGDYLDGREGADYLAGGNGSDIYIVDDAGDTVVEFANQGTNDKVVSAISYTLGANVEHLVLSFDSGDIDGAGNGLANNILGNNGANRLDGGAGNDTLRGAGGADTLTGGTGKDVFQYFATADSQVGAVDHITDFTRGEDKLDFKSLDAKVGTAVNDAFKFIGAADFSHKAGELRYEAHDGYTLVQGDVNGDGAADFAVSLDGFAGQLKSADFLL